MQIFLFWSSHFSVVSRTIAPVLFRLFDKVRKEAQDPMRAARAYESIIQSIMQAEAAAKQALTRANETIQIVSPLYKLNMMW